MFVVLMCVSSRVLLVRMVALAHLAQWELVDSQE